MNKLEQERKERNKKDKEWAIQVKNRFNNKCAVCGEPKRLNAHHIIPRENKLFRWDLDNGIALCPKHHQFSREISAHASSFIFHIWLSNTYSNLFTILLDKYYQSVKK